MTQFRDLPGRIGIEVRPDGFRRGTIGGIVVYCVDISIMKTQFSNAGLSWRWLDRLPEVLFLSFSLSDEPLRGIVYSRSRGPVRRGLLSCCSSQALTFEAKSCEC